MAHSVSAAGVRAIAFSAILVTATPTVAAEPGMQLRDYTAVYKVLRNGKELAAVTVNLSHQQDIWKLHGYSHDTRGFAKFLKIKGEQTTNGHWQNGRFKADRYTFSFNLIGYRKKWQADFDWQNDSVKTTGKWGEAILPMDGGSNDPFSLSLNLSSQLAENPSEILASIIDEDEIEQHVYQVQPREKLDTPLGCINTVPLKRIRENSKRVSLGWYAQNYNLVPVRMWHKNKKGNTLELTIATLQIDGVTVPPGPPCSSQAESGSSVRRPSA